MIKRSIEAEAVGNLRSYLLHVSTSAADYCYMLEYESRW